jgi:hypothetical protein
LRDIPALAPRFPRLFDSIFCGGRGTKCPPGAIDAIGPADRSDPRLIVLAAPRAIEFSGPRAGIPRFPRLREAAGGVIRLTVGRENALPLGRDLARLEFGPSLAWRVGVALIRLRPALPLKSLAETRTELP